MPYLLVAVGVACALALWHCLYTSLWHPLASYPGPRLAALTRWYRAYYDIVQDGGWLEHLTELHRQYGPVVRVGASELHFSEPDAYNDIYGFSKQFNKDPELYNAFDQNLSSFGQVDPAAAKARRETLGPLFSRQGIRRFEFVIQDKVDHLVERLVQEGSTGKPINLFLAFRSFSFDTIMSYCFATSYDSLDYAQFAHPMIPTIFTSVVLIWTLRYFPFLIHVVHHGPRALIRRLSPVLRGYFDLFEHFSDRIDEVQNDLSCLDSAGHDTIFHHLLIGKKEKPSKHSLMDEAVTLFGAGSETTGGAVTTAIFFITRDGRVRDKLFAELREAWPDMSLQLRAQDLEKLPYLTAVIKESMRLAHGVVTPAPRIVGKDAVIAGHAVPAGTTVAQGVTFVHMNPEIYHDPETFMPERWMEEGADALENNYFLPFSKGPRMCLGHNLAWCEMYLVLGNLLRKTAIHIHNTDEKDFEFRQYWLPIFRGRQMHGYVDPVAH
ncbi:cytochrome P450 [Schizophyllum amplum]|uniref:Cytochrome P450 n=1 Tax=Schizophyllum amplum TaxID=97359 RepID=A0A550C2J1_9AGAR|nr:cytochrome P450 [Auriculariopsis ampla]